MKKLVCLLALAALVASVNAAPIGANDLVVTRVGDGSGALSGNATATFLDEYTPAGVFVQTIPMPTAVVGSNRRLTNSGSATSEGFLSRSTNGQYLMLAGYDAAVGTTGIVATTSAAVNRVVARVDASGNIDTTTALTDAYSAGNIRSATSTNGTAIWTSGTASTTGGVRYTTLGGTTTVQLATTPTNIRVANIFSNQLYCSSASGAFLGVCTVGTGLPTTSGQTITLLSGFPNPPAPSSYDFWFGDSSTLYVADDLVASGGIQKWTFSGTTWTLQYTLRPSTTTACRGLVGELVAGNVVLFATTTDSKLVRVTDTGSGSTFTQVAGAGTYMAFRDVQIFPEPSSLLLLGLGAVALVRRR